MSELPDQPRGPDRRGEDAQYFALKAGKGLQRSLGAARVDRGAGDDGNDSRDQDAVENRAGHLALNQHRRDDQPDQRHPDGRVNQAAHAHEGRRVGDDDARVLEAEKRQKRPDARRDGELETRRNGLDDGLPRSQDAQNDKQRSRNKHRAQRRLPGNALGQHHRVSEESIQAHAGSLREGVAGDQAHHQRPEGGGDGGGHQDLHEGVVDLDGIAQHLRIDEQDVTHGQEGGDSGADFLRHIGAGLGQLKESVKGRDRRRGGAGFRDL